MNTIVDEAEQTVTLSMKAIVEWQDARLDVNRSNDKTTEEKYVFDSDVFLKFDQKFLEPEVLKNFNYSCL